MFNLLTKSSDQCFEDNFTGQPLTTTYLQRKLAPQKVAVHSGELIALLDADQLQLQNLEESNTAAVVAADGFEHLKEARLLKKLNFFKVFRASTLIIKISRTEK